ncbi:MAG TPA: hypothetical protein DCE41_14885 [Cytophagales bacterium]|nr:hypothetical protein [Cytophagales bacterium]HAA22572.1 hypothetical protein [Cytophagales bacterium]HAP64712.1 hypothetical protein [Cytophagales bacterium]
MQKMTTEELANRLRDAVAATDLDTISTELFAEEVESIEPTFSPLPHAKGLAQVKEKWGLFGGAIKEMHGKTVSEEVIVQGNLIVLGMSFHYTNPKDERVQQDELIVYKTKDGKIISEEFIY